MISFIVEEEGHTRRVEVPELPVHIGRAPEADIRLTSGRCSRHHARVESAQSGFVLLDLDSSNGTWHNGERIRRVAVQRGDRISVGEASITFLGGDLPASAGSKGAPAVPGYTILDDEGEGVLTRVWLARQEALGRKVALKVMKPVWQGRKDVATRFLRLARQQSRLHHPGLAAGIDVGEAQGIPWFAVEHLEGDTLASRVRSGMACDLQETCRILSQLLETAAYVHNQGQLFANLHPEAVMLGDEGEVWITACGWPLSGLKDWPDEHVRELAWLPPEALELGPEGTGPQGDVFQIGALGLFMLTGRPLRVGMAKEEILDAVRRVEGEDALAGQKNVPAPFRRFLLRLLAEDPAERPQDGGAALDELEAARGELERGEKQLVASARAAEDRAVEGPAGYRRSRRFIVWNRVLTAVIAVVLNGGLLLWWTGRSRGGTDEAPPVEMPARQEPASAEKTRPASVAPEDVAQLLEDLRKRVEEHLQRDEFIEALALAEDFVDRYRSAPQAAEAARLAGRIQQERVVRCTARLDEVEAFLDEEKLDEAEARLKRVRSVASEVSPERLALLEGRLRDLRLAAVAKAPSGTEAGGNGRKPAPAVSHEEAPGPKAARDAAGVPRARWKEELEVVERRLSEVERRQQLLDSMDRLGAGELAPAARGLVALQRGLEDLAAAWKVQVGKAVRIPRKDGGMVSGTLKGAEPGRLCVGGEHGEEQAIPVDDVAPAEMVRLLAELEPTLDRYLVRARLNALGGAPEEAWFDLQAARILAAGDADARALVDGWLAALGADAKVK